MSNFKEWYGNQSDEVKAGSVFLLVFLAIGLVLISLFFPAMLSGSFAATLIYMVVAGLYIYAGIRIIKDVKFKSTKLPVT